MNDWRKLPIRNSDGRWVRLREGDSLIWSKPGRGFYVRQGKGPVCVTGVTATQLPGVRTEEQFEKEAQKQAARMGMCVAKTLDLSTGPTFTFVSVPSEGYTHFYSHGKDDFGMEWFFCPACAMTFPWPSGSGGVTCTAKLKFCPHCGAERTK